DHCPGGGCGPDGGGPPGYCGGNPCGLARCALRRADRRRRKVTSQTTKATNTPKKAVPKPTNNLPRLPRTDRCGPTAIRASEPPHWQQTRYGPGGPSPGLRNSTYQWLPLTLTDSLSLIGAREMFSSLSSST